VREGDTHRDRSKNKIRERDMRWAEREREMYGVLLHGEVVDLSSQGLKGGRNLQKSHHENHDERERERERDT
jgi:hypothetical protein